MRSRLAVVTFTVLAVVLGTKVLGADDAGGQPPRSGSHVRIEPTGGNPLIVGTLVSSDDEGLRVEADDALGVRTLRWDEVAGIEVGQTRVWRGIGTGVLVGVGTMAGLAAAFSKGPEDVAWGAAVGALAALPASVAGVAVGARHSPGLGAAAAGAAGAAAWGLAACAGTYNCNREELAIIVGLGVGLGVLSGGLAAAVAHERWRPSRRPAVRVSVVPIPGRGAAGAVTVSF